MNKWVILAVLLLSQTSAFADSQSATNRMCDAMQALLDSGKALCKRQELSQNERLQLMALAAIAVIKEMLARRVG